MQDSCILVPSYSEIYPLEDLIWDNNNQALKYREDILNLHHLDDNELIRLRGNLEQSDHDDYKPISELIGVAFDENSGVSVVDSQQFMAPNILLHVLTPMQHKW